jgi:hypothetical protein
MPNLGPMEVLLLLILFFGFAIPAYVVGERRGLSYPGVAFIPLVGPWIVVFRSIGGTPWLVLLTLIPIVSIGIAIWTAVVVPMRHGRTMWWALWFLIPFLNVIGFFVYAFTLTPNRNAAALATASAPRTLAGSTAASRVGPADHRVLMRRGRASGAQVPSALSGACAEFRAASVGW